MLDKPYYKVIYLTFMSKDESYYRKNIHKDIVSFV